MKMHRELEARTTPETASRLLDALDERLPAGWRRGSELEAELGSLAGGTDDMRCYVCTATSKRDSAALWVSVRERGTVWVSNIVPHEKSELSIEEYNRILEEFANLVLGPAAHALGIPVELSADEPTLEDLACPEPASRLRQFARAANKFSGAAHPLDRQRWNRFVIAAHEADSPLSAEDLGRWLVEVEGWPEDVAHRLTIEYESARSLLKDHDRDFPHADAAAG